MGLVDAETGDGCGLPGPFCLVREQIVVDRETTLKTELEQVQTQDEYSLIGEVSSDLAHVTLKPGESPESLLRRFRKKVTRERILSDVKKKRFFIKKSDERRRARRKAARKEQQRLRRERRRRY